MSGKNQDMAVEIIFQCGDKDFWEHIFSAGNEERRSRKNICEVYEALLEQLQQDMFYDTNVRLEQTESRETK